MNIPDYSKILRAPRPLIQRGNDEDGGAGAPERAADNQDGIIQPEDVQLLDQHGNAIPGAAEIAPERVTRANAAAATANLNNQNIAGFVLGYPTEEYDAAINFLAPRVRAPFLFRYRVKSLDNAYAVMQNTGFGINGRPQIVRLETDGAVTGQLQSWGLQSYLDQDDIDLANADPDWGQQMEMNERLGDLRMMDRRGELQRILALFATSAGAASAKTWNDDADPMKDLQDEVEILATEMGSLNLVRLAMGTTFWKIIYQHVKLTGTGATVPKRVVTLETVANYLGLPVQNLQVMRHQAVTTKQGQTAAKGKIFTADEAYLFGASSTPSRNDRSFVKRFAGTFRGQEMYGFQHGISTGTDQFRENFGFVYREKLVATNGTAVKRLSAATS